MGTSATRRVARKKIFLEIPRAKIRVRHDPSIFGQIFFAHVLLYMCKTENKPKMVKKSIFSNAPLLESCLWRQICATQIDPIFVLLKCPLSPLFSINPNFSLRRPLILYSLICVHRDRSANLLKT